jgi:SnoaL-like domain
MERSYALIFARLAVCIVALAVTGGGRADGQEQDDRIARKFFELREQTLDQRGTTAQVEQVLALFKKNGRYEHPAASVIMTLDEAKRGMIAHLKEGRDARITIRRFFHNSNFTIAETTLHYFVPDDSGNWTEINRNGVAIFELEAGRIARLAEY